MNVKQSMLDNKSDILESLPTQELKDAFLAELEKTEDTQAPSIEEQVKEAQAYKHLSEELYDGIKKELESTPKFTPMSEEEQKAAIEEALKNPPKSEE